MELIQVRGDTMEVEFRCFDMEEYRVFLQSKKLPEYGLEYCEEKDSYLLRAPSRFAHVFGINKGQSDRARLSMPGFLFDYQGFIVRTALNAKRYAVWADTGLGKTAMYLEWARQVNHRTMGRVLLIVPLNIIEQTLDEAAAFYGDKLPICRLRSRDEMRRWCENNNGFRPVSKIAIVNPEKFIPRGNESEVVSEIRYCAGVVLDESSLLKSGGGRIKWALIKSCRGVEYKLSCTATPAPNDTMEYASQGSFLEKLRNEGEILWTYFTRDRDGNWKVKRHAEEAFFRFMSGWSIYLRSPARYGFKDNLKDLPPPEIMEHKIAPTVEQRDEIRRVPDRDGQIMIFGERERMGITERIRYSQIAKGFIYVQEHGGAKKARRIRSTKPGVVVDLVRQETAMGLQVLVWTVFDEESEIIAELLAGEGCFGDGIRFEALTGKTPRPARLEITERFRKGETAVLVSKASLLGFGLNFQNCGSMIFSGFDDSFERFYQAVRRAYRYGQKRSVRVHIPYIPELEGVIWENIQEKEARFVREAERQEINYLKAMKGALGRQGEAYGRCNDME